MRLRADRLPSVSGGIDLALGMSAPGGGGSAHTSPRSDASGAPHSERRRTAAARGMRKPQIAAGALSRYTFLADQQRACLIRTCRFRTSWSLVVTVLRSRVGPGCSRASLRTAAVVVRDRRPGPVPHSCPKRPGMGGSNHAGRGALATRKPASLLALEKPVVACSCGRRGLGSRRSTN